MIDREKIISALENCSDPAGKCRDCPYEECERSEKSISEYPNELIRDAVKLLKEQEPRVLTLEELKTIGDKDAVYLETIVMNLGEPNVKPAIYQPDNSDDEYIFVVSTWCKSGFYSPYNYLKTWRCWSAKPTVKQRGAVPWTE